MQLFFLLVSIILDLLLATEGALTISVWTLSDYGYGGAKESTSNIVPVAYQAVFSIAFGLLFNVNLAFAFISIWLVEIISSYTSIGRFWRILISVNVLQILLIMFGDLNLLNWALRLVLVLVVTGFFSKTKLKQFVSVYK